MAESFTQIYILFAQPYMVLISAFILDLLIGDPMWLPHPVRIIGWAVAKTEIIMRKITREKERLGGILLVIIITSLTFSLFYVINRIFYAYQLPSAAYFIFLVLMVCLTATTIATKELISSGQKIFQALKSNSIENARKELGNIVGRDTNSLDRSGVIKAAIESLAENASDGIIAPIFYFAIGGLPLAMTYKAINTMDSMIGYKNERYRNFGRAAARLDDIANYIPARITGLLIALSSFIVLRSCSAIHYSLKTMLSDSGNHPSPNSGVPESALAGALGVRLGGPSTYGGLLVDKPWIGEDRGTDYSAASLNAVSIVRITAIFGALAVASVLYVRTLL